MSKKITLSVLTLLCFTSLLFAQVGIGTTSPADGAILDVESSTSGIMIPRVALTARNVVAPIVSTLPTPEVGLMVFNTATAGTAPNNVTPGFYFWNGIWERMASGASTDWALTGNARTTPGTAAGENYIGTSDAQDVVIATDGDERMRVQDDAVLINTTAPLFAGDRFTVQGESGEFAINGYTSNGGAIYGLNNGNPGWGVLGESTNIGVEGYGGLGVIGESPLATGFGIFGVNTNASGTGILGGSNLFVYNAIGSGLAGSGNRIGVYGYAGVGNGINANRGNSGGLFFLDADSDPSTNAGNLGYRASARLAGFDNVAANGSNPPTNLPAQNSYFGGYFAGGSHSSGTPSYAFVGLRHNTNNIGTTGTDYKIIGPGTVSTLISDSQGIPRIMFAPESPEIVFQDYGVGQLINGQARINLDPILKSTLHIDDKHPLKVFVTLEGDCNGIYVTDKSADGFTVKELQGGTSNVSFSWQIVANRADTKDANGNIVSKHVGLRLPVGPGPILHTEAESIELDKMDEVLIDNNKSRIKKSTNTN